MTPLHLPPLRLPRPPIGRDPFRRSRIPRDLSEVTTISAHREVDPRAVGLEPEGIDRIWRGVERLYRSGVHPAIALTVRREGEVVLDRAIGHARGNGPEDPKDGPKLLATPETPFCIFSASKAITAVVAHLLDERGLIHIGDRVAEYIPEYAKHHKHRITIEHVLSHKAGVANLPAAALDLDNLADPAFIVQVMCDQHPAGRPGKALAYHAISGGFIIGEIVRRVCGGRDIRQVLRDEVLDPLGFEWTDYGVPAPKPLDAVAVNYATGPPTLPPVSTVLTRALGVPVEQVVATSNDPRFLRGILPAANTVTTADELSRFFELLRTGGELDGTRILETRTIRRAISEHSYREFDWTLGFPTRYGAGFMLGAQVLSLFGPDTQQVFGHLGFSNVLGWADPARALSVGLITSGKPIVYPEVVEVWELTRRIAAAAPKVRHQPLRL